MLMKHLFCSNNYIYLGVNFSKDRFYYNKFLVALTCAPFSNDKQLPFDILSGDD